MARAPADHIQICRSITIKTIIPPPRTVLKEIYRDTGVAISFLEVFLLSADGGMKGHELATVYPRSVTAPSGLFEAIRRLVPYIVVNGLDGHLKVRFLVDERQLTSLLAKNGSTLRKIKFRSGCTFELPEWDFEFGALEYELSVQSVSLNALQVAVEQITPLLAVVTAANRRVEIGNLSPHVPDELAHLILLEVGVKDLTRFKLAAKEWNVRLNSLDFANDHYNYKFAKECSSRVLFQYRRAIRAEFMDEIYLPIETNGGIWTDSELRNVPLDIIRDGNYACTSHGLICVFVVPDDDDLVDYICLWNPTTERFRTYNFHEFLPLDEDNNAIPYESFGEEELYGCSYSHADKDFMVVYIESCGRQYCTVSFIGIYSHTMLRPNLDWDEDFRIKNSIFYPRGVSINGSIHWLEVVETWKGYKARVLTLNLEDKSFQDLIVLPDYDYNKFVPHNLACLDGKLSMTLMTLQDACTEVWLMTEYGNPESWIRFTTISHGFTWPLGISKGGGILTHYDFVGFPILHKYSSVGTLEWGHLHTDTNLPQTFVESLFSP